MVTALEVALSVPVWLLLLPTVTLPKFIVDGPTERLPEAELPPPPELAFILAVTQPTLATTRIKSTVLKKNGSRMRGRPEFISDARPLSSACFPQNRPIHE
jgi:hypothetical protein